MVRPSQDELVVLESIRESVFETMGASVLADADERAFIRGIPLGLLRKNATQRHGVTRWKRAPAGDLSVTSIELHPRLLTNEWQAYGTFVMYHEILHALGFRAHDAEFRRLEACWPDASAAGQGKEFTRSMRMKRASWMWVCSTCDRSFPRQRPGRGKFQCRSCGTVLLDRRIEDAQ